MLNTKNIVFNNEKNSVSHGTYNVPDTVLICKIHTTHL